MNDQQLLRYSRHILLDEIGIEGQQHLLDAHVLLVGVGGLGSPAALYLAASGVGRLTLVDDDNVELTNLQRQILHATDDIGQPKAASGKAALHRINPGIAVTALIERADQARLGALVATATVVLDCSDNFATRHAINGACIAAKVPLVSGAASAFSGQLSVFDTRNDDSPCYACLFPAHLQTDDDNCATMGVFAPLVGIIGAMQAAEALKLITNVGDSLAGRLLLYDARRTEWTSIGATRDPACASCSEVRASAVPPCRDHDAS